MRTFAVLLLAAAIVAVGTGCGGGSKTDGSGPGSEAGFTPYEKAMLALGSRLNMALIGVGAANRNATGPAALEANLRRSQVELRAAASKLAEITPPADIKAQHQQLIRGVREYADELDGIIAKVKKGGGKAALAGILSLKGLRDMAIASTAITKAGYVISITNG